MIVTGRNGITRRKTCASVTFPTTDRTDWLRTEYGLPPVEVPQLFLRIFFAPYFLIILYNTNQRNAQFS
jgi:hypothetical protein